jgi:hypothetical protein
VFAAQIVSQLRELDTADEEWQQYYSSSKREEGPASKLAGGSALCQASRVFEAYAESGANSAGSRVERSEMSFTAIKKQIRRRMLDPASVVLQQSELDIMRERLSGWNLVRPPTQRAHAIGLRVARRTAWSTPPKDPLNSAFL